jgi:outer membrane protein assembly factor BamB/peptidoglycan/xylan/chitin deacetylase (PgdA/CDA1 family)
MTKRAHGNLRNLILLLSIFALLVGWCTSASAQLASGPWPMFRHDLRHSALSPYPDPTPTGTAWTRSVGGGLSSPVIASDGTIYIGGSGSLYALNSNGTVKWTRSINSSTRSTPAIASDGTIYIGSGDYRLYAVTSAGGAKWSYLTGGVISSSPAIGPDGVVYVGSRDGWLYAINPSNGSRKWRYNTGDIHMGSPAVSADGTVVYCGGGTSLWAIYTASGALKWSYSLGAGTTSSAAISADGSTIYIGCYDGNLYAVSSTGGLVWRVQVGFKSGSTASSPAVGADGTIYIGSNYGSVYAIYPDGTEKWIFETKSDVRSSVALNADGTLYLGAYDGYVYALNSATGAEKWHYLLTGGNYPSPAIAADGTVVAATIGGVVFGNLSHTPATATPPSNLTASVLSETEASLAWQDNSSDEYGFRIEKRLGTVGAYTFLTNVGAGVQAYTDSGLQSGMTYYYRVCAYQQGGLSAYTNEAYIDTPGLMTPTGLVATPITGHQVDLSWTDRSSDELGFRIERSTGPNGLFEHVADVGENVSSYSDMSPYPATNYYYRVRAFDATRDSSYSNEDWALTPGKDFTEIERGDTTRKQIALTFDAGTAAIRSSLLSILQTNSVYSTFFITGYVTDVQNSQVAQMARDGHHIGNHTYDHPDLRFCTDEQIVWQFSVTDDIIRNASGHHTQSFFRAPYGARNDHALEVAADAGYRHVAWTADSGDAAGATTQQIINNSIAGAQNGAIILYHCTIANTEAAIPTVITELRNQGYELVTVPELIAPKQVSSPQGEMCAGWNLISIPIEPALPFPHIVFRGTPIDGTLYGWITETRSQKLYDAWAPELFGNISPDEGYWLWLDTPRVIKCNGSEIAEDRHIKLPEPPADQYAYTMIGYPFETAQEFGNCKIFNPNAAEPKTRSVLEATDLGWIPNALYAWDAASQSQYDVGVPEYWPSTTLLEPWHGYFLAAGLPGLELIIPKPQ